MNKKPAPPARASVRFRPIIGTIRQIRVTTEQLHGTACVLGTGCTGPLVDAGRVYTDAPPASPEHSRPVVAHPACLGDGS